MNIKIVLEGKLKEEFYKKGVEEYRKRLSGRVEIVEVDDIEQFISNKNSYIVTLELEGKQLDSIEFANKLRDVEFSGESEILFLIGGAEGLKKEVRDKSNFKLSLSRLTFLHQEAVLILVEQIYRAHKILNNEKYHR